MNRYPTGECRDADCHAEIIWTVSRRRGKPQPIDAHPAPGGTILLTREGDVIRSEVVNPDALPFGVDPDTLHKPHHETCPGAARWRNTRRPS